MTQWSDFAPPCAMATAWRPIFSASAVHSMPRTSCTSTCYDMVKTAIESGSELVFCRHRHGNQKLGRRRTATIRLPPAPLSRPLQPPVCLSLFAFPPVPQYGILSARNSVMAAQLYLRLSALQFMQYFLWGAWYVTLGSVSSEHGQRRHTGRHRLWCYGHCLLAHAIPYGRAGPTGTFRHNACWPYCIFWAD